MTRARFWAAVCMMISAASTASTPAQETRTLAEWRFGESTQWNNWWPGATIRDVSFHKDGVTFETSGHDPQIMSPHFDVTPATNQQWLIVDLDASGPGQAAMFYTNSTEGQYGGLRPQWVTQFGIPAAGRQSISVWPFWGNLERIIRLRFDPPDDTRVRLHSIRIVEMANDGPAANWIFDGKNDSWQSYHAVEIERTTPGMIAHAREPQAVIITTVKPFDAANRSLLTLDAACPGENLVSLHWASDQHVGLFGEPIRLRDDGQPVTIDLRRYPMWQGTISHLAIAFGTAGSEMLTLHRLSIDENDPAAPHLRTGFFGFERGVNRPNEPAALKVVLEHAGGPAMEGQTAELTIGNEDARTVPLPAIRADEPLILRTIVVPQRSGDLPARLVIGDQTFTQTLRVDKPINRTIRRPDDGYDVPEPRPVKSDYEIGVYYFPGWHPERGRWLTQAGWPERDSLLGWYREGSPVVADWHIKWAVENGISFFVYDWYWRDGQEHLHHGLNEGLLNARYRDHLKFALMWANHAPYADHSLEQLLEVTDYWIERYFKQSNYLTIDGAPYVSFFAPSVLQRDLGSREKVAEALEAMRDRARAAGLKGIHFGACGGTDAASIETLEVCGFDSNTGYNYRRTGATLLQSPYRQYVMGHEAIWEQITGANVMPYIPLLTVGWDSVPWHGPAAERRFARSSKAFAEALGRLRQHLDRTGRKIAILEAWNEWGEGSYIEPNVEFGFEDLEAIRETFAQAGSWPVNIAPDDLGLPDKYDYRFESEPHPQVVPANVSIPDPRTEVGSIELALEGTSLTLDDQTLQITPAEIIEVRHYPVTLVAGPVQSWRGGNRLPISRDDLRNLTPDSYVPGSLRMRQPGGPPWRLLATGDDVVIDDVWGAFALAEGGRLKPGTETTVLYEYSLRRIDALVLDRDDRPRIIRGTPSPDCPEPPPLSDEVTWLANIYRPFNAKTVEPRHIYAHSREPLAPPPIIHADRLKPIMDKMRDGDAVKIVCWGDSVTVGGDASSPEKNYVGLFESMLRERFPKATISVINAGIGGSNTQGRLPAFQAEVLDHKPDLVTLEFVNDMGMKVDEMQQRYPQILERIRDAGAELLLITPHFTRPDWMGLAHGRGLDPRTAVAFLKQFAHENNVPLADASRRWEQLQNLGIPYETLLKNGINHPDDRGHRIFAEELMRYFPEQRIPTQTNQDETR